MLTRGFKVILVEPDYYLSNQFSTTTNLKNDNDHTYEFYFYSIDSIGNIKLDVNGKEIIICAIFSGGDLFYCKNSLDYVKNGWENHIEWTEESY